MTDVAAVHRAVAELLTDTQRRRAWRSDPVGYSAGAIDGCGAHVIARLEPERVEAAALNLDLRRVTSSAPQDDRLDIDAEHTSRNVHRWPAPDCPRIGLGFWPDLYTNFDASDLVQVWEHRVDDYLWDVRLLDEMASRGPVSMHSVGLSLGSTEVTADLDRLNRVGRALRAAGVEEFSDHLAFSQIGGIALEHFIPVWRVEEALSVVVDSVKRVQDTLGVRLALENIAPIVDLGGDLTVAEFLNAVVEQTGCGVLLDVTNLTLCAANGFCDATAELEVLDLDAVIGVHVAGGEEVDGIHFDAHAFGVAEHDVLLLGQLMPRMPNCRSVIVERDARRGNVSEIEEDLRALHAVRG
jgi:uncharacterized protein (UPF0276 family)